METITKAETLITTGPQLKTNLYSLSFILDITRENMVNAYVLSEIFNAGCRLFDTPSKIEKRLSEMNGGVFSSSVVKKGGSLIINVTLETLKNISKSQSLSFLEDIIYNVQADGKAFEDRPFKKSKKLVLESIESRYDDKRSFAMDSCLEEMYDKDGFGIPDYGYNGDLERITKKSLYSFYSDVILKSDTGIKGILGTSAKIQKPKGEGEKIEDRNIGQGRLCMGYTVGREDIYSCLILNEILGGSGVSKLFNSIREKENLCYYVSTTCFRHNGIILAEAGIEKKEMKKAFELIEEIFKNISNDLTEDDLERGKTSLINRYLKKEDSPYGQLDNYIDSYLEGSYTSIGNRILKLRGVSLENLRETADSLSLNTKYFLA